MQIFNFLKTKIEQDNKVMLLLVVQSKGSSPGRQGFKMGVDTKGEIFGSIGGGIMEYNLVEEAKTYLEKDNFTPIVKKQIHRGKIVDGSGMICSGEQLVLFYLLTNSNLKVIDLILKKKKGFLSINPYNIKFDLKGKINAKISFTPKSLQEWTYCEKINQLNKLFIIGAGHVGLATSELFAQLNFEITIIDNRNDLNTLIGNSFIHNKIITNYSDIEKHIPEGDNIFVAIMTNTYKSDAIVLKKIITKKFKYLGVLGSKAKIKKMFSALQKEGISKDLIEKVHAPIGISIHSQTPMEIAVSIAGEIVRIKNAVD